MKAFKVKILASSVTAMMLMSLSASASEKQIGDLSVYQPAKPGAATITMMLDTSGSMDQTSINSDYGVSCKQNYSTSYQSYPMTVNLTDSKGQKLETLKYNVYGCEINYRTGKEKRYDRLSRLKLALIQLFADGTLLSPEFKIGVGNYSANGDTRRGQIMVPAKPLTAENRKKLISYIDSLTAYGGTPSANAYAEAGAYMMGTTSSDTTFGTRYVSKGAIQNVDLSSRYRDINLLHKCDGINSEYTLSGGNLFYTCYNPSRFIQGNVSVNTYPEDSNGTAIAWDRFSPLDLSVLGGGSSISDYSVIQDNKWKYLYKKIEGYWPTDEYSGFGFSSKETKTADLATYQSPITASQCDGYGVYFLTDGEPNSSSGVRASSLMDKSLGKTTLSNNIENIRTKRLYTNGSYAMVNDSDCKGNLTTEFEGGAWGCIGEYAKQLRDATNPSGQVIKTAAVGFGSTFTGSGGQDLPTRTIYISQPDGTVKEDNIADCSKISTNDAKNLCLLGEKAGTDARGNKTGLYGQGGFTATSDPEVIQQSVINFAADLVQTINASPSGTISVPVDPLSSDNVQPFAYLPMLEPKVGDTNTVWPGNLKKYNVNQGTLFGQNDSRLYIKPTLTDNTKTNSFPFELNPVTKDIWMGSDADFKNPEGRIVNNAVQAGGVYARLRAPKSGALGSVRSVWVEDITAVGQTTKRLVKVGVDNNGNLVGFNNLVDPIYKPEVMAYLLNFLGYNSVSTDPVIYSSLTTKQQILNKLKSQLGVPTDETKVLGGVVHSKPELVSYGGDFLPANKDTVNNLTGAKVADGIVDADAGQISNDEADRKDFIMFGSMEGAVHLVDARTGEENFAVIPISMLKAQVQALKKGSTSQPIGQPLFGVDAPWTSKANYRFNLQNDGSIEASNVYAYGGLRMGGEGLYGLNISNANAPELMFSINRNTGGTFKRLGQTWSKPITAKIKTGPLADDTREVLIFGGGYDMCYESATFKLSVATDASESTDNCTKKRMTYGNAVYMVDALTGEKIWSWSGSDDGGTLKTTNTEMKHSVVGGITALDRNDNGTIDHLYFSDLGGQIFRIDLKEGVTGTAMTHRLVKVFDANAGITLANHIPFRFYERPIVSFYDNAIDERFAAISIASGDRSSPLSEDRSVADSDRVYSIFDRDVAQQALFGNLNLLTNNLTTTNLTELPFARAADRLTIVQPMQTATRNNTLNRNVYGTQGWYYPLNRFDGNGNVANVKSVGEGIVIGGFYYMTAYAPQMDYGEANSCTAKVKGGSERQLYCMPYGVCNMKAGNDYMSANGTGGFTRAGPGIQELVLGAVDANQRNTRVLLGNLTITELAAAANRYDFGTGPIVTDLNQLTGQLDAAGNRVPYDKTKGDGSSPLPIFAEGFRLVPNRWYELQNNK